MSWAHAILDIRGPNGDVEDLIQLVMNDKHTRCLGYPVFDCERVIPIPIDMGCAVTEKWMSKHWGTREHLIETYWVKEIIPQSVLFIKSLSDELLPAGRVLMELKIGGGPLSPILSALSAKYPALRFDFACFGYYYDDDSPFTGEISEYMNGRRVRWRSAILKRDPCPDSGGDYDLFDGMTEWINRQGKLVYVLHEYTKLIRPAIERRFEHFNDYIEYAHDKGIRLYNFDLR
jgi:hypothetical protein